MKFKAHSDNEYVTEDFAKRYLDEHVRKRGAKSWFLVCPFHSDRDPSLSVIVSKKAKQRVGFWRCFGCGRKGYWNELAIALNMPTVDGITYDLVERDSIQFNVENDLVSDDTFFCGKNSRKPRVLKKDSLHSWPETAIWRKFPGKIVRNFGGYMNILDFDYPLAFVCRNRNALKDCGIILCRTTKKEKQTSYLFTDGEWTHNFLWPEHKIKSTRTVVLVEGVRDALAWLCLGVPTLAILGTQTGISDKRLHTLIGLGIERIILFMDGDKAGKRAVYGTYDENGKVLTQGLKSLLIKDFDVQVIKTWKHYEDEDPFSLAQNKSFVKKFKLRLGNI